MKHQICPSFFFKLKCQTNNVGFFSNFVQWMYKVIYKTNIIYQEKRVKSRGSRYLEVGVEGGGGRSCPQAPVFELDMLPAFRNWIPRKQQKRRSIRTCALAPASPVLGGHQTEWSSGRTGTCPYCSVPCWWRKSSPGTTGVYLNCVIPVLWAIPVYCSIASIFEL